jgi:hypothetical protein
VPGAASAVEDPRGGRKGAQQRREGPEQDRPVSLGIQNKPLLVVRREPFVVVWVIVHFVTPFSDIRQTWPARLTSWAQAE